jgi:hypothetical protein
MLLYVVVAKDADGTVVLSESFDTYRDALDFQQELDSYFSVSIEAINA